MQSVKEIVRELKVFERNKIPLEIKVLGIATYIQTSSVRRTAKILSEIHPVSNLCLEPDYYIYAIDVERNELILMRVYTTRNFLPPGPLKKCSNTARTSRDLLWIRLPG